MDNKISFVIKVEKIDDGFVLMYKKKKEFYYSVAMGLSDYLKKELKKSKRFLKKTGDKVTIKVEVEEITEED